MTRRLTVYCGSYTEPASDGGMGGDGEGIVRYTLDPDRRTLRREEATPASNPSFLALAADRSRLYAVNERNRWEGAAGGGLSAFRVDRATGRLELLNQASTGGADPCHVCCTRDAGHVLAANYTSGSVVWYRLEPDGSLGERQALEQLEGEGPNRQRQRGPHAHGVILAPEEDCLLVPNLGADEVRLYRPDFSGGRLLPGEPAYVRSAPGAGPRYGVFHPWGELFYCANELDSSVTAYRYHGQGRLEAFQTVSSLVEPFAGENSGACLQVHPQGEFLYASNRGQDTIAVFAIQPGTGRLEAVQACPSGGKTPRHFAMDPTGELLLAANQGGGIAMFSVDRGTGRLEQCGEAEARSPTCLWIGDLQGKDRG